jgi:phosphoribosylglycinamide formyltransferase-1
MTTIGIITYDFQHLKTEQIVHGLLRKNHSAIKILAFPFASRPERAVLIPHRPNQADAISTEGLARANDLEFIRCNTRSELPECDLYLVAGASILPAEVVAGKKIINAHPGIIPSARGLDAFKWSIQNDVELGVTLHYIDASVDGGEIIAIVKTPVYQDDNLLTLARRHYELEVEVLTNFSHYLTDGAIEAYPVEDARRRMPIDVEAEMCRRFDAYKDRLARKKSSLR